MKLSFTTLATPQQSAEEVICMAREYGYQAIDLRVSEYMGEVSLNPSKDEIKNLRRALQQEEIECSSLLCYNDCGNEEVSSWTKMEVSLIKHIRLAEELGVKSIRIFTGEAKSAAMDEEFLKRTANVLMKVLDLEKSEVELLIQNHRNNSTALQTIEIVRQIANPRMGMIFSPDHCIIENEDMDTVLKVAARYTRQMYFADICKEGNKFRNVLPGKGQVPLMQAYQNLIKNDFKGWLTFKWEKIWHPELEEPEFALPFFINYLRNG